MTSSDKQNGEQLSPEQYAKMHQMAFRTAFDFLTAHFPPGVDADWWQKTATDASDASITAGENKLVVGLLSAVYNYLDYEFQKRRENNEQTDD